MVGPGAAGITICKELLSSGLDIILLEAGGAKREKFNQSLYEGESLSPDFHAPPSMYRQRRFGGSTTIWGGRCVPLDKGDFAFRGWVSGGGWPIGRIDLYPYYERAMPYFEVGNFSFDEHKALDKWEPLVDGFRSDHVETSTVERFSAPTDFGKVHGADLKRSHRLRVIVQASCLGFVRSDVDRSVDHIYCSSIRKNPFQIEATK